MILKLDEKQRQIILTALDAHLTSITTAECLAKRLNLSAEFQRELFDQADNVAKLFHTVKESQ